MKKKAIKRFLLVFIASVLISAVFVIYHYFENGLLYSDITVGKTYPKEINSNIIHDADAIATFGTALSNAIPDEKFSSNGKSPDLYIITHTNGQNIVNYELYISSVIRREGYLFNTKAKTALKLKPEDFTQLLSKADFADASTNNPPEPILVTTDNDSLVTAVNGYIKDSDWSFAKPDASYQNENQTNPVSENYFLLEGNIKPLRLIINEHPSNINIKIYSGGTLLSEENGDGSSITNPGKDGLYTYEIKMQWDPSINKDYFGEITYYFNIKLDNSAGITLSSITTTQGQMLKIRSKNIKNPEQTYISCKELGFASTLTKTTDGYITLLPISCDATPGEYKIKASADGVDYEAKFTITNTLFEEKEGTYLSDAELETLYKQLSTYRSDNVYMTAGFFLPPKDSITIHYGTIFKSGEDTTRFKATEFKLNTDEKAFALQKGRVIAVKDLTNGYVVAIDHGLNIVSYYFYLSKTDVNVGDIVEQGSPIGLPQKDENGNSSAISFAVRVNGIAIDPDALKDAD